MTATAIAVAAALIVGPVNGFAIYILERSQRRRLDAQGERISEIESHVGLRRGFPYDVACPTCGASIGRRCYGDEHSNRYPHAARYDVSPQRAVHESLAARDV